MRVLLVGPQWIGRWTESTEQTLSNLGHSVQVFYYNSMRVERLALGLGRRMGRVNYRGAAWLSSYQTRWEKLMNQRLRRLALASNFDLVLVLKGETLDVETVALLRSVVKNALVTWWLDDPLQSRLPREAIRFYHAMFVFDKFYFGSLSEMGASEVYFLPCCADPQVFRPIEIDASDRIRYSCDVSFVGVFYPSRGQIFEQLGGLRIGIWGPQWDTAEARRALSRIGGNAWRAKLANQTTAVRIYNASKISLNVHHPQSRLGGLNLRTFEALACGAFLLTDYVPGMDELLIPGEQVACYSAPDQVRSRVDYFLAQPDERAHISQRGRERVLREHTYQHRMETMLDSLHLSN